MGYKKACCEICKKEYEMDGLFPLALIRSSLYETIKKDHPECNSEGYICYQDLKEIRSHHVEKLLEEHRGALSDLDKEVMESLKKHAIVARNINKQFQKKMTFSERISDKMAKFGGSWVFILSFVGLIIIWMIGNTMIRDPFDPYPYILLNLVLSCLAALQAPIIMMSQNRQAKRDRMQADDDYKTNLKAELEIRQLNSRMDMFVKKQWERLLEIQQIQIDLAEEIIEKNKKQ